mgnify:CR=1 FL=1
MSNRNKDKDYGLTSTDEKIVLYGQDAVDRVRKMERGRKLSKAEDTVIREEGFVDRVYTDTKGVKTFGVGQTGKYMGMPFKDVFKIHEDDARKLIPSYDIMSAAYRGDLQQSPTFRKLFNKGDYKKAAKEFLDNKDYRKSLEAGTGVAGRMERVANIFRSLQD